MLEWIGWTATAMFTLSYFARRPTWLRLIQGSAALLWILYGWALGSLPVMVANLFVALAAGLSLARGQGQPEA